MRAENQTGMSPLNFPTPQNAKMALSQNIIVVWKVWIKRITNMKRIAKNYSNSTFTKCEKFNQFAYL